MDGYYEKLFSRMNSRQQNDHLTRARDAVFMGAYPESRSLGDIIQINMRSDAEMIRVDRNFLHIKLASNFEAQESFEPVSGDSFHEHFWYMFAYKVGGQALLQLCDGLEALRDGAPSAKV